VNYEEARELERQFEELVPGLQIGMLLTEAHKLILAELKRLKEVEAMFEGLCK
jgi:hypothetical protein